MTDQNAGHLSPPKPGVTGVLVLADGTLFWGYGVGAEGDTVGEVCFNTSMSGYQEILTDPSYAGQIINFTFPHIGNVGANDEDMESTNPAARGFILREPMTEAANDRATTHSNDWAREHGIIGLHGGDTRRLTRYIHHNGEPSGVVTHSTDG